MDKKKAGSMDSVPRLSLTGVALRPAPFCFYVDRSGEPDDEPHLPIVPFGQRLNLLCILHVMLDEPNYAHIISWMPHGRAWKIHNEEEFKSNVLPRYNKKCTFKSFMRQVDIWGFLRMSKGENKGSYYHEYFLRGLPHLCKKMERLDTEQKKGAEKDLLKTDKCLRRNYEPDLGAVSNVHPLPQSVDRYHLDVIKSATKNGPDARMVLNHHSGDSSFSSVQRKDTTLVRDCDHSDSHNGPLHPHLHQSSQQPPFPQLQQLPQQSPLQPQQQVSQEATPQPKKRQKTETIEHESKDAAPQIVTSDSLFQRQQQISRWQTFLSSYVHLGIGTITSWSLFNDWSRTREAPMFTEEDEQQELRNLSADDLSRARADAVGSSTGPSAEELAVGRQHLLTSLRLKIIALPVAEKAELVRAISYNSEFFGDTWLMRFLQVDDFNIEAAAKRMASYWQLRTKYLGQEKAFLPFTIKNAFREEHIYMIKIGLIQILPVADLFGRTILFVEPGRAHGKVYDTHVMVRSILYVLNTVLESDGVVIVVDHKSAKTQHLDARLLYEFMNALREFPIIFKGFHICNPKSSILKAILPFGKYFLGPFLRQRIFVHNEQGEELLERLKNFGLLPENLPTELGGNVALDNDRWVNDRIARGL